MITALLAISLLLLLLILIVLGLLLGAVLELSDIVEDADRGW